MRLSSFISGVLTGSLVGATLAILMAPKSGDDLRSQIRGRLGQIQSDVASAAAERRIVLEQELERLRSPKKST